MQIESLVTGIIGLVTGVIGSAIAVRRQQLEELRLVIEMRGEEIERLARRVEELEEDNARLHREAEAKAEAIADLVERLDQELNLRNERERAWARERRRLLEQIECLKKELAELKVAWENNHGK